MKNCPFCAEEVQDDAIVCKHCNRDIGKNENLKSKLFSAKRILYAVIILVIISPIAVYASYTLNKKYVLELVKSDFGYDDANYSFSIPTEVAFFPKTMKVGVTHNKSDYKWDVIVSNHNEAEMAISDHVVHGWVVSVDMGIKKMDDLKEVQSTLNSVYQRGYIRGMNAEMDNSEKLLVSSTLAKYNIKYPKDAVNMKK